MKDAADTQTHLVWQAAGFCAATVIGRGGCAEPSWAGAGGVLAAAQAFEKITALGLFD